MSGLYLIILKHLKNGIFNHKSNNDMKTTENNNIPNVEPGQYEIEIAELESLGWDFWPEYDQIRDFRYPEKSNEEIQKEWHRLYNVIVTVHENGITEWRFDAGAAFSNNQHTGDDDQTIKDVYYCIQNNLIVEYSRN